MVVWNAVSKHAKAGACGWSFDAVSMSASAGGMCSGAECVEHLRGDAAVLAQMRAAVDDTVADGIGPPTHISAAELLKFLRGVLEGARLRIVRGVFTVDGFACAVGDGERTAGLTDGVGSAAVDELRLL